MNAFNPHFSQAFYCGGGSGHVYCVAPPRYETLREMRVKTPRNSVAFCWDDWHHFSKV